MDSEARRRAIQALDDKAFELFVHELLAADDHEAGRTWRKMRAPDGGADSLVREAGGVVTRVVQAKHYPDGLTEWHWKKCKGSLDKAINTWDPPRITFVFPLDFTQGIEEKFNERLVARAKDRTIDALTLTDLDRLAGEYPLVTRRFLGPDAMDVQAAVERATRLGGHALRTAQDLVARAEELADFADEADPQFIYQQTSGPIEAPEPVLEKLPYMTVRVQGERKRVRVDAWAREEVDVTAPQVVFNDDEEGEAAREQVRCELAAGKPAVITAGVRLYFSGPKLMRELIEEAAASSEHSVTFPPSDPLEVEVRISSEKYGEQTGTFAMRPVPPLAGADRAFAAFEGALWAEMSIKLHEKPKLSATINFATRFGPSAHDNAVAIRWLLAYADHEHVEVTSEALPPGVFAGQFPVDGVDIEELRFRLDIYEAVEFMETALGIELSVPDEITQDDLNVLGTVETILRTGEGTATFRNGNGVVDAANIAGIEDERNRHVHRRHVIYELWGHTLDLGMAEYSLPPLRVVSVTPLENSPDSPARVEIAARDETEMPFRLVEEELRRTVGGAVLIG